MKPEKTKTKIEVIIANILFPIAIMLLWMIAFVILIIILLSSKDNESYFFYKKHENGSK
jgi:hypothetical protein